MVSIAYKTPDEVKDWSIDWTAALSLGETIVSSTWSASDPFLNVSPPIPSVNMAGTITTVWLSGGATNQGSANTYTVTNEVVTSQGETLEESFTCVVSQYNSL